MDHVLEIDAAALEAVIMIIGLRGLGFRLGFALEQLRHGCNNHTGDSTLTMDHVLEVDAAALEAGQP